MRGFAAGFLALAIAAVGLGGARHAYAAYAEERGLAQAARAATLRSGLARDTALLDAQAQLRMALALTPKDAALWVALAQVRHLQAGIGASGAPSPTLLQAALEAAERARALRPQNPQAALLIADARAGLRQPAPAVAEALSEAYRFGGRDLAQAPARLKVAGYAWAALDVAVKRAALLEACNYAAASPANRAAVETIARDAPNPAAAAEIMAAANSRC